MRPLAGKTALVTEAWGGIGRAISERLGADGALVAIHYGTGEQEAKDTARRIESAGGRAFLVKSELGTMGGVDALLDGLRAGLDGRPLNILVSNVAAEPAGPIETDTPEAFDHMFAANVRAPYFIIQRALGLMSDGGRVISISAAVTRVVNPAQTSFAMTMGAVETMSRTLAQSLGSREITVNAVAAGVTKTEVNESFFTPDLSDLLAEITALGRLGRPEDIADAVAFLASDQARWLTGQVLDSSGGILLGGTV